MLSLIAERPGFHSIMRDLRSAVLDLEQARLEFRASRKNVRTMMDDYHSIAQALRVRIETSYELLRASDRLLSMPALLGERDSNERSDLLR